MDGLQDAAVARFMAVVFVDFPEVVQVDHHQRQRFSAVPGQFGLADEGVIEEPAVIGTGKFVGYGAAAGRLAPVDHVGKELAGIAQALSRNIEHPVHDLGGDVRVFLDHAVKILLMEPQQRTLLKASAGCGPGRVLENGHFPEEIPGPELGNLPLPAVGKPDGAGNRAAFHDEKLVPLVTLPEQHLALFNLMGAEKAGNAAYLLRLQEREYFNRAEKINWNSHARIYP